MKGKLLKSKDLWYVEYTTHKTIGVVKGVMGSGHKIKDIQSLPLYPADVDQLSIQDINSYVDFNIVPYIPNNLESTNGETVSFDVIKYAKLKQD